MKLKSFGCSFIFGSDLADDGRNGPCATPSQSTWPALLAKRQGRTYSCYASPGAGNLQILENILNQSTASNSEDLFVIGWTWIDRFDYYDANYNPHFKATPWATIMPTDSTDLAKVYYRDIQSEYQDKFTGLCYIKLAIDILRQRQIPFVMTYIDELLFDQRWHSGPGVIELQQYIKPCMTKFDELTFLEWSRKNNYPESAHWHPLEAAHIAAADLIESYNLV